MAASEPDWAEKVELVLERLPTATWTSYGELAELVGTGPRQIARFLSHSFGIDNAFRVLRSDGRVSDGFHWSGNTESSVYDALREQGIEFSPGLVADPDQRLDAEELHELIK